MATTSANNSTRKLTRAIDMDGDESGERLCEDVSERHRQYINDNLETLREQCNQFKSCLDELYSQENQLLLLEGNDLGLEHICDLVQTNEKKTFNCEEAERVIIREDLTVHLDDELRDDADNKWTYLKQCTRNSSDGSALNRICRWKLDNGSERNLCDNYETHVTVERFLNNRLESLQCTCNALPSAASLPMSLIIGAAVGGLVVLILVAVIVCLVVWRRKKGSNKTKRIPDPWEASFSASNSDKDANVSMYSEISDSVPLNRMRKDCQASGEKVSPPLPSRYVKDVTRGPAYEYTSRGRQGNAEYLQPLNPKSRTNDDAAAMTYEAPWDKAVTMPTTRKRSDPMESPCGRESLGSHPSYQAPDPPVCDAGEDRDRERGQHDDDGYETLGNRTGNKKTGGMEECQDKPTENEARTTIL